MTRGDVFRVRLPRGEGHQQAGARYGVVVQTDGLAGLSTVIIAPTSTRSSPASHRPEIEVEGQRTKVLAEHVRAVDHRRLGAFAGHLTLDELEAVDDALLLVLDL